VGPSGLIPKTSISSKRSATVAGEATPQGTITSGTKLAGRYLLHEKLGEGGMGTVFAAVDEELDRPVAVKLLNAQFVADAEIVGRFERESRLMARLDHPNIVPVYDVGRHQQQPYIVMKRLTGMTLASLLKKKGGFSPLELMPFARQLAQGLDYIHAQKFIHRDIKSSNIFVSTAQEVSILDFGILRTQEPQAGLTRQGMVMGTPHYMAPEQALGLPDVDCRVDIYALAVVLFECLSGGLPFDAASELQLIHLQAHAPAPNICSRAPWLPLACGETFARALLKDPNQRFGSASELVEAVAESCGLSIDGLPPRASAPPLRSPPQRTAQMSRLPAPAPLPVGQPSSSQLEPVSALSSTGSRRSLWWLALGVLPVLALGVYWLLTPTQLPRVEAVNSPDTTSTVATIDSATELPFEQDSGPVAAAMPAPAPSELIDETRAEPEATADSTPTKATDTPDKKLPVRKRGKVNVVTTHNGEPYWAQVSVDGVAKGRTPLVLDLEQGKHAIRVERSGFRAMTREIKVASGKPLVIRLALTP
jgi:serine/threonine protein kinase